MASGQKRHRGYYRQLGHAGDNLSDHDCAAGKLRERSGDDEPAGPGAGEGSAVWARRSFSD